MGKPLPIEMSDARYEHLFTAVNRAVRGIPSTLAGRDLGTLNSWEVYPHEYGWILSVVIISRRHGGRAVLNRRVIMPAGEPQTDPETAGIIYATGLLERLLTANTSLDLTHLSEPIDLDDLERQRQGHRD